MANPNKIISKQAIEKAKGHFNKELAFAQELLDDASLFYDRNEIVYENDVIVAKPLDASYLWQRTNHVDDYYSNNKGCYLFKLVDQSFFAIYAEINDKGNPTKYSYSYCSCVKYDEETLLEKVLSRNEPISNSVEKNDEGIHDSNEAILESISLRNDDAGEVPDDLLSEYLQLVIPKKKEFLIKTIMTLAHNPIYVRFDFDSEKDCPNHPRYHLTINLIEDSRFKIEKSFTYADFVAFVLDVVYGVKERNNHYQFQLSKV